jgi:hypothetical protein
MIHSVQWNTARNIVPETPQYGRMELQIRLERVNHRHNIPGLSTRYIEVDALPKMSHDTNSLAYLMTLFVGS